MHIGILGSGQLGRMLALAGAELGHTFSFYDVAPSPCTAELGTTRIGAFDDLESLKLFAAPCDVITYEFENVPCDTARFLETCTPVHPPARALEVSQDRLVEKEFLQSLGISTPRFQPANSEHELSAACKTLGYPCIAKTRRFGYDGKGQQVIRSASEVSKAWQLLGAIPLLVEGFVPFSRELSVIATRSKNGDIAFYPISFNIHSDGILHRSELPAPDLSPITRDAAQAIARSVLNDLEYVGTLAIELFEVRGEILANELAPRVHNSGHATIEGTESSQFKNHIRAISGVPLGSVEPKARAVMYNIIGAAPDLSLVQQIPNSFIHLYGKVPKKGRKLGHITLLNPTESAENLVSELCSRCKEAA